MIQFLQKLNFQTTKDKQFFLFLVLAMVIVSALIVFLSPWKALAVLASIILIILALFRPQLIILFLAAYVPLEPFLLKFVPDEIYVYARYFSEGLIYVLLFSVFLQIILRKKKFIFTPIDFFFIAFLFIAGLSLMVNRVPLTVGALGVRQIIRFILFYYAVVYVKPKLPFIKKLAGIMLALVFLEGLLGIAQAVIGVPLDQFLLPSERKFFESIQLTTGTVQFWEPGQRVFATLGRYDQLGTFLSFFMLLIVGWLYYLKSTQNKKILGLILFSSLIALLLTYSRASWFGFLLGFIVISIFIKKDRRAVYGLVFLVIIILSYLLYSGIAVNYLTDVPSQTLTERFFEAFSYERWRGEYYGLGRMYFIVHTFKTVLPHSPIFGVGPGQYGGGAAAALHNTTVYDKLDLPFGIYGTEGYIDNNWLSLLGETGILGFIFYAGMFVVLARSSMELYKKAQRPFVKGLALGYLGALVAVTFEAFLAQHLEVRTLALYFWMFGGFVVALNIKLKEEKLK